MTDNLVNQIEITIHCIGTQNHQKDNQLVQYVLAKKSSLFFERHIFKTRFV